MASPRTPDVTLREMLERRMAQQSIVSQPEAARLLGVDTSTFSRWMTGAIVPGDGAVPALAEFLGEPESSVAQMLYQARKTRSRLAAMEARLSRVEEQVAVLVDREERIAGRGTPQPG